MLESLDGGVRRPARRRRRAAGSGRSAHRHDLDARPAARLGGRRRRRRASRRASTGPVYVDNEANLGGLAEARAGQPAARAAPPTSASVTPSAPGCSSNGDRVPRRHRQGRPDRPRHDRRERPDLPVRQPRLPRHPRRRPRPARAVPRRPEACSASATCCCAPRPATPARAASSPTPAATSASPSRASATSSTPSVLVIGGELAPGRRDPARAAAPRARALGAGRRHGVPEVVQGELGEQAELIGCLALAIESVDQDGRRRGACPARPEAHGVPSRWPRAVTRRVARPARARARRRRERARRASPRARPAAPDAVKIALLLPDSKTARYETFDQPYFERRITELGDFDGALLERRPGRREAAVAGRGRLWRPGSTCSCSTPSTARAAVSIVAAANAQGVPVIAYDRFISGGDLAYYVSFDNENIGRAAGEALVDELDERRAPSGGILMVNGSPTDNNAGGFKAGAHSVLDASGYDDPRRVRHPRLEPRQGAGLGRRPDHPVRRRHRRRLRRQRRHGERRDRRAQGRERRAPPAGHRAGCRARRHPAHRRRRPVHDHLQGHQAGGRGRRRDRGRARARRDGHRAETVIEGTPTTLLGAGRRHGRRRSSRRSSPTASGRVDEICTPDYAAACEAAGIR